MMIWLPVGVLAVACTLLFLGVEPVPVYFYLFAWYPTLALLDGLARRADGRPSAFATPPAPLSVWLWSAPVWLLFEAFNLRLDNWYYVFVPPEPVLRWAGILLSFATVVPAILLAERLLDAWGIGKNWSSEPVVVTPGGLRVVQGLGVLQLGLALAWPGVFFPLVWGGMLLLCEPIVYRRRPDLSLFADLEDGYWGRAGRLLIGGAGIGLLWETFNFGARAKWIYTVPGLENLKVWEMPLLGFVGFPFFALEAWAMYHALCVAGVAIPLGERRLARPRRALLAGTLAVLGTAVVMRGIERGTVSSVAPTLADLPGVTPPELDLLRRDPGSVFRLAAADRRVLAGRLDGDTVRAEALVRAARLITLRGIGATHARWLGEVGISSVCELGRGDPELIWLSLQPLSRENDLRPTRAEVRVWQQAAARACTRG